MNKIKQPSSLEAREKAVKEASLKEIKRHALIAELAETSNDNKTSKQKANKIITTLNKG